MIDRYGSGIPDPVPAVETQIDPDPNPEAEVTIGDIARALGIQVNSTRVKARRGGWPRRQVRAHDEGNRHGGRRRHFLYRVDALPAGVRHALAVPALSPAARESYAGLPVLAQAMGLSPSGARKRLERLSVPWVAGRARSRGREYLYPLSALEPEVRAAVERIRAGRAAELEGPEPVSCACCGQRIADPEQALACGRCEEAVCARSGCMRGDKCRRCRKASRNWRYRNRVVLARAAAALDASRAARGECPAAELAESGLREVAFRGEAA